MTLVLRVIYGMGGQKWVGQKVGWLKSGLPDVSWPRYTISATYLSLRRYIVRVYAKTASLRPDSELYSKSYL
jgi:hypothetical protein